MEDDFLGMEMPTPCCVCAKVHELNDLRSCSDGEVRCDHCFAEFREIGEEYE